MKKAVKQVAFLLVIIIISFSCKKEEEQLPDLTTEEAIEEIHTTLESMSSCVTKLERNEFSTTVQEFFKIGNEQGDGAYAKLLVDELKKFNFDKQIFDLQDYTNTYNWNIVSKSWDMMITSDDKIVFNFPFKEDGYNNNVCLTLKDYSYNQIVFKGENIFLPTSLFIEIKKDGDFFYSFDIDNLAYSITSESIAPTDFNLQIITTSMTYNFDLEKKLSTSLGFDYTVQYNGCNTSFDLTFTTKMIGFSSIKKISDFNYLTGEVRRENINISFNVDIKSLNQHEEPTIKHINDYIKTDVFVLNQRIGFLVYEEDRSNDYKIFIVFKDGEKRDINDIAGENYTDEIKRIIKKFSSI